MSQRSLSNHSFGNIFYEAIRPLLFTSKKFKKSVYYNPHFTIDKPDSEDWLNFYLIIILLRYNIFEREYDTAKRAIVESFMTQRYSHHSPESLRRSVEALDNFDTKMAQFSKKAV